MLFNVLIDCITNEFYLYYAIGSQSNQLELQGSQIAEI